MWMRMHPSESMWVFYVFVYMRVEKAKGVAESLKLSELH